MADGPKSFFDEPVSLTLAPFREFGFASVSSWSEVELYATAAGVEVDANFLNVMCAASYCFDNLYKALLAELSSPSGFLDSAANSVGFAECLFKVWTVRTASVRAYSSLPQAEVESWLFENGIGVQNWHMSESASERKKYALLAALDAKFPYLLVKFYALHSRDLRTRDMRFVTWLTKRLEARAVRDSRLEAVLKVMRDDAQAADRTAMYMR